MKEWSLKRRGLLGGLVCWTKVYFRTMSKNLMITMYKRIVEYSNLCSSVHDYIIKFWLQIQVFGYDTSNSKCKGKNFRIQEKHWKLQDLKHDLKKVQQKVKALIRRCIKPRRLWWEQTMMDSNSEGSKF